MTDPERDLPALPAHAGPAQHGTMVPLPQVALLLGVSMATVRRRLHRGELEGAELQQGPHGAAWHVPLATVESLRAAERRPSPTPAPRNASPELHAELAALQDRLRTLELELARERTLAQERAEQLSTLHETVRTLALTAGPQPAPARRHWWNRRTNV